MNENAKKNSAFGTVLKVGAVGGIGYGGYVGSQVIPTTAMAGNMLDKAYAKEGGPGKFAQKVQATRDKTVRKAAEHQGANADDLVKIMSPWAHDAKAWRSPGVKMKNNPLTTSKLGDKLSDFFMSTAKKL